jgi:uncharacterized protein YdhG (YjbR/CyaY superfamily)
MVKILSDAARVRAYIAAQPPGTRRAIKQLAAAIRSALPKQVEHAFSYRIPAFRVDGKIVVWYAAFTRHTSMFPMTAAVRRAHARALEGYHVSTGTVRFPLDERIPVTLVRKLVKARLTEMRSRGK